MAYEYKVPTIPYPRWRQHTGTDSRPMMAVCPDYQTRVQNGVGCMAVQKNEDGSAWELHLFETTWPTNNPIRTLPLGSTDELLISDAVVKAIELAAIENDQAKVSDWTLTLRASHILTASIEARSKEEAIAKLTVLFENDPDEALGYCSMDEFPEYSLDEITAADKN